MNHEPFQKSFLRLKLSDENIMNRGFYVEVDGFRYYFNSPHSFATIRDTSVTKKQVLHIKRTIVRRTQTRYRMKMSWDDLTQLCEIRDAVKEMKQTPEREQLVQKLRNAARAIVERNAAEQPICVKNAKTLVLDNYVSYEFSKGFYNILLGGDINMNPGPVVGCCHQAKPKKWDYNYNFTFTSKNPIPTLNGHVRWSYNYYIKQLAKGEIALKSKGYMGCSKCCQRWFRLELTCPLNNSLQMERIILGNPGFPETQVDGWLRDLTTEGINPNPGPVAVLRSKVKMMTVGDGTHFTLPNGKTFVLGDDCFQIEGHLIEFTKVTKRIQDELKGAITQDSEFIQNLEGKPMTLFVDDRETPLFKSTIWSDHDDFKPEKRLAITPSKKFESEFGFNDFYYCPDELQGRVYKMKNFLVLPKDALKVRFSKKTYSHKTVDYQVYLRVRSSVINQSMCLADMSRMASLLATLQMLYMDYPYDRESCFALFSILYDKEICYLAKNGPSANNKHSACDLWEHLLSTGNLNLIPTYALAPGEKLDEYADFPREGEFYYTREHFMNLASTRFSKPVFPEDPKELVAQYKRGALTVFSDVKSFSFHINNRFQPIQTSRVETLTEIESAVRFLVEDRMYETNLVKSIHRMLDYAVVRCSPETVTTLVKKLVKYDVVAAYHPGLSKAYSKPSTKINEKWPENTHDQIEFIGKHLVDEKIITTVAQSEFQTWCLIFGQPTKVRYFNNLHYIQHLSLTRRAAPNLKGGKEIIQGIKNFCGNVGNLASSATNISENVELMKNKFVAAMDNRGMVNMALALKEMDFSSFKNSLDSLKIVVNSWFTDFAEKVCGLFGVTYEQKIDATKLLFYYIVWQHTDSFPLQVFIVSEVLIELGVFDFVMLFVKKLAIAFRDMFKPEERGLNEQQEAALLRMQEVRNQRIDNIGEIIKDVKQNESEVKSTPTDNDIISDIIHFLSEASVPVLGVAGTVLISCFGLTPFSQSKPGQCFGERIVQSARNISFLAMGLVALPKIYENIIKVFYGVIDYAKEIFCENHLSVISYHRKVEEWLKKAAYSETASKSHLVSSLDAVITFFHYYGEMQELKKRETEIRSPVLMQQWTKRCKVIEDLYQIALSAGRIMLGNREIFHIQLYSKDGGVGKTDAATNLLTALKSEYITYENDMRRKIGLNSSRTPDHFADTYPLKETLNHSDMYYGQRFGYIDEDLVNSAVDPDKVLDKMTLLSGFPAISQQASLADKGRIFEIQVLLSNTNNPTLPIKDMMNLPALFRRRHLIRVDIRPEVAKVKKDNNGSNMTVVDDEKCQEKGFNRSKGDHLLFSVVDSITANDIPGEIFVNMDFEGFVKWSKVKMQEHFAREEMRLFSKSPHSSLARLQFDTLVQDLKAAYGGNTEIKNMSFDDIRKSLDTMKQFVYDGEELNPKSLTPNSPQQKKANDLKKHYQVRVNDLETVIDIETMTPAEMKQIFGSTSKGGELVKKTLIPATAGLQGIMIANSENEYPCEEAAIDFNKFKWCSANKKVVYIGENDEKQVILYWLLMLEGTMSEADFQARMRIYRARQKNESLMEKWKAEIANVHRETYRAIKSGSKWILSKTLELLTKSIVAGIATAIAITAMFFGLAVIGRLLVPEQKGYNEKQQRKVVKMKSQEIPFDQEIDLAKKSVFRVKVQQDDQSFMVGTMVAIQGTIFLINKHVLGEAKTKIISIYDPSIGQVHPEFAWKSIEIGPSQISYIPDCDAALIDTRGYRPVKRVIHHFVTEEDLKNDMENFYSGHHSIIATGIKDGNKDDVTLVTTGFREGYPYRSYPGEVPHKRVLRIVYNQKIAKGWSGGITVHSNPKIPHKFIGIVLSQDLYDGIYVGVISREEIETAMKKFPEASKIITPEKELVELKGDHQLYDVFDLKENLFESPIRSQAVSESAGFMPTKIHGCVPVETEPAIQHANDPRIPDGARHFLKVSLNKTNGYHEPFYTLKEEKFMKEFLRNTYVRYVPQVGRVRVLNTSDAIKGQKLMGSTRINTKTSAGLPYKLQRGVNGKAPFIRFNDSQKSWEIQQFVFEEVERYEKIYRDGFTPNDFKMEFRKKELVGKKKIEDPKTRTVATGNFINQIVYDKNFKDLYRLVKNTWELGQSSPFALGVDPERHWNQIAEHLKYTDFVIDFDVKAWEEKVCLPLLMLTADVKIKLIEDAYRSRGEIPPKIRPIVEGLAVDYTDTYVVFENLVYRKRSGLLSGHPGTFMENSEIHEVILALLVYRVLLKKAPAYATVQFIQEHVRSIKAADDIQIALSPLARNIITVNDLVKGYNALGFELTAADKGADMKFKKLEDSQFLKNGFKLTDEGYQCLPNKSIINQLLNWMRTDTALSYDEQFDVNIQNAFRFLFWHGEEEYEETRRIVNEALLPHSRSWPLDYYQMAGLMKVHLQESEAAAHSIMPAEQEEDF